MLLTLYVVDPLMLLVLQNQAGQMQTRTLIL